MTRGTNPVRRICIVGAGAIGGFIGARLALAAQGEVCALARGDTLAALRTQGWRLLEDGTLRQAPAHAEADAGVLGPQDLVIIAVKGPALEAVAQGLAPLLGPDTIVLPAMNGVPWWFAHGIEALGPEPLASVDPGGRIAARIEPRRVLGCVVHASASMPEPGLVRHAMGQGLIVGEPSGGVSARAQAVAELLSQAGFDARASADIRYDVWYKLWGNMTINPVSAITGATADCLLDDELVRNFCSGAMREAAQIGRHIGCAVTQEPEERHAVTRRLGAFKTSMLQDVEAGRPIELDALVGAVHEMGRRLRMDTPCIDALLGLTRLFARTRGLYRP